MDKMIKEIVDKGFIKQVEHTMNVASKMLPNVSDDVVIIANANCLLQIIENDEKFNEKFNEFARNYVATKIIKKLDLKVDEDYALSNEDKFAAIMAMISNL